MKCANTPLVGVGAAFSAEQASSPAGRGIPSSLPQMFAHEIRQQKNLLLSFNHTIFFIIFASPEQEDKKKHSCVPSKTAKGF